MKAADFEKVSMNLPFPKTDQETPPALGSSACFGLAALVQPPPVLAWVASLCLPFKVVLCAHSNAEGRQCLTEITAQGRDYLHLPPMRRVSLRTPPSRQSLGEEVH